MSNVTKDDFETYHKCREIEDPYHRRVALTALLTKIIKDLGYDPPIVVGGTAVSVYSGNTYATVDVDFISNSEEITKEILIELGYKKMGKDYYHEQLESLMEFPSRNYEEDMSRIVEYTDLNTNLPFYIIGIEDLILDRMGSYAATNDLSSKEWAIRLMLAYYDHLDWSYIHSTSHKREFFIKLEEIQRYVKYLRKNPDVDEV